MPGSAASASRRRGLGGSCLRTAGSVSAVSVCMMSSPIAGFLARAPRTPGDRSSVLSGYLVLAVRDGSRGPGLSRAERSVPPGGYRC